MATRTKTQVQTADVYFTPVNINKALSSRAVAQFYMLCKEENVEFLDCGKAKDMFVDLHVTGEDFYDAWTIVIEECFNSTDSLFDSISSVESSAAYH